MERGGESERWGVRGDGVGVVESGRVSVGESEWGVGVWEGEWVWGESGIVRVGESEWGREWGRLRGGESESVRESGCGGEWESGGERGE